MMSFLKQKIEGRNAKTPRSFGRLGVFLRETVMGLLRLYCGEPKESFRYREGLT